MFNKKVITCLSSIVFACNVINVNANAKKTKEVLWSHEWTGYALIPDKLVTFNNNKSSKEDDLDYAVTRYKVFSEDSYKTKVDIDFKLWVYDDYTYGYSIELPHDIIVDTSDTLMLDENGKVPLLQIIGLDNQTTKYANKFNNMIIDFKNSKISTKSDVYVFNGSKSISIFANGYNLDYYDVNTVTIKKGVLFSQDNITYKQTKKVTNYYYHIFTDKDNTVSYYKYEFDKQGTIIKSYYDNNEAFKKEAKQYYFSV